MIVEDDTSLREVLVSYVELLGLTAVQANNGKHATEILSQLEVDLLITDFRMPQMDGVSLLNWCRKNGVHVPVIFLSANADLVPAEQMALADCCATLMYKPINLNVFTSAIGAADSRSHHRDCVHFRSTPVD